MQVFCLYPQQSKRLLLSAPVENRMRIMKNKKKIKAAMTVEASLLLPLFILLFMNLLSMIEVYRIHSNVAASLWERGREEAVGVYLRKQVEEAAGIQGESAWEILYGSFAGKLKIVKNLEDYPVWEKIVVSGKAGFLVTEKTEADGTVRIDCSYRIHPLFSALTPSVKTLENHYCGHAWIGYVHNGRENESGENYVYITETGRVYHKNRGCSYLNPSIKQVQAGELGGLRNKEGAIYYSCSLCDDLGMGVSCYITDYGSSYHRSVACSGLKRTIYEVKLSETEGRGACSKCGG